MQFAVIHHETRFAAGRNPHHVEAQRRRREGHAAMRRIAAGNEAHLIQAKLLHHFQCRPQMTEMDRIEGAAENTNHQVGVTSGSAANMAVAQDHPF